VAFRDWVDKLCLLNVTANRMDNPETLTTLGTQSIGQKHNKITKQYNTTHTKMSNMNLTKKQDWLTVTKYPYLKWQWIFSLLPTPTRLLPDLNMRVTQRMLYKNQELLTLREGSLVWVAFASTAVLSPENHCTEHNILSCEM
jgi:hypothetical protein